MVELRWLRYESYSNPDTGEHFIMASTYKRLQYRVLGPISYTTDANGHINATREWGEWQDAPEVSSTSNSN